MKAVIQDVRFGLRTLLKNPGSTVVAVLALTLGIGANTAIFSVVSAVLLRPLPYQDPEHLVVVWNTKLSKGMHQERISALDFQDFVRQQQVFDLAGALRSQPAVLTGTDMAERVETAAVSPSLLGMLGLSPVLGRAFAAQEDEPGKNHLAIISDGLWRRRFGAASDILGKPLILDGIIYTIVGVIAPDVRLPDTPSEVWIPYTPDPKELAPDKRAYHFLRVIAHLKTGVTLEQAQDDMRRIARRLEEQYNETNAGYSVDLIPLREQLIGDIRPTLWTLIGAVVFVLLIACANVANLLLARAGAREKEIAVRTALGANPGRLVRQLLTESVLLSLLSGVGGLLLAYWGVSILEGLSSSSPDRITGVSIDWRVLVFTLGVSIVTGIIFGIAPALASIRTDLNSVLKTSGRSTTGHRRRTRVRNILVISEIACCVVLLAGAGLLIRSFLRLQQVNPGFRPDHVLTMQISLPEARYSGMKVGLFYKQLIERVQALPGAQAAGVSRYLPLGGSDASLNFQIESQPVVASADQPRAKYRAASPGYFSAMGIPLIRGRYFDQSDGERTPGVAIINEAMARRYWPNENPLGKRIQSGIADGKWSTIVGVVGNVKHMGLDAATNEEMYYHYLQAPVALMSFVEGTMTVVVRTASDPAAMTAAIRNVVRALDPDQPVFNVKTMQELVQGSVAQQRFRALLWGVFAALALTLAAIGLYGVISYSVTQRVNELGVRTALGAQSGDILKLVVGQAARLAAIGIGIGVALALGLTRMLNQLLFGVGAMDPITFASTCIVIFGVALAASYIPALRATRVDPVIALRNE